MLKRASKLLAFLACSLALSGCAMVSQARIAGISNDLSVCPANSNCWYQPDRTIRVAPNQSPHAVLHEACHGWQGRNLPADDIALSGWKQTPEGAAFPGTLEQAADVCASWYLGDPEPRGKYITTVDPRWYEWARVYLP